MHGILYMSVVHDTLCIVMRIFVLRCLGEGRPGYWLALMYTVFMRTNFSLNENRIYGGLVT